MSREPKVQLPHMYLITYNLVSTVLWAVIFVTNLKDIVAVLFPGTFDSYYLFHEFTDFPHKLLVITQVMNTICEILHSLTGLTKSPVSVVLLQFFARDVICIGVCYLVPLSSGNYSPAFMGLLVAWSVVELIRYPYYLLKIGEFQVPGWLNWLRYSAFLVLYPLGLVTEPVVVYKSLAYIDNWFHYYFFTLGLGMYIPGMYILYSYMLKQRRKMLSHKTK